MYQKTDTVVACTIGIDTGKNTLHLIGLDDRGAIVLREKLTRGRIAARLANVPRCLIGVALASRHHFLWVYCPACHTMRDIDLRTLDRYRGAAVTSLIPSLSCRSCRPHAPFAELVCLSRTSIADEMRVEYTRRILGE
jgi:hypothetical protein